MLSLASSEQNVTGFFEKSLPGFNQRNILTREPGILNHLVAYGKYIYHVADCYAVVYKT